MAAGRPARIEHSGQKDWSFAQQGRLDVRPGQIYELGGWVRLQAAGDATLCVTLRDRKENVTDWVFAGQTIGASLPERKPRHNQLYG